MPHRASDAELIDLVRQGAAGAFEELVQRHQWNVRWQILRTTGDSSSVDDLAQEVFIDLLNAVRGDPTLQIASVRAWLRSVAHNKSVDAVRRSARLRLAADKHREEVLRERDHAVFAPDAGSGDADDRELAALSHCLGLLQPHHRELIDEFYGQGKSSELIAVRLGKGAAGVRLMLTRIRRALGSCIRKHLSRWIT